MATAFHRRSLRTRRTTVVSAALVVAGAGAGFFVLNANADNTDLYHHTLAAKDGWASSGSGTTGGAKADSAHTFTVSTRAQLVKALGSTSDTPRIIKIKGTIDANTDDSGKKLSCSDYSSGTGYSLSAYLKAYDPATDLVAAYNSASSKKIKTTVNWTPTLTAGLESSAKNLPTELANSTGAGVLS